LEPLFCLCMPANRSPLVVAIHLFLMGLLPVPVKVTQFPLPHYVGQFSSGTMAVPNGISLGVACPLFTPIHGFRLDSSRLDSQANRVIDSS
jgi:hypothetical protein